MKTIGLIGGMSWESTAIYYRLINQGVQQGLGGLHSARIVLVSLDFAPIQQFQHQHDWQACGQLLVDAAQSLEKAGAECILLCTNTMHKVADQIEAAMRLPFLHIADVTARQLKLKQLSRVGLLGTQFTMQEDFYKDRLRQHGIDTIVPTLSQQQKIHSIIYQELCLGKLITTSKETFKESIVAMQDASAEAVILGCTEIGTLLKQADSPLPLFDTTQIHAHAAVAFALNT